MPIIVAAQRVGEALLSLFFPSHCAHCGADTVGGAQICAACADEARRLEPPMCERCSEPFPGAIFESFTCANCAERKLHFDCAVAPYRSRGIVREFIHRFKYDRDRALRQPLAAWLADALADERISSCAFTRIVPVPLHPTRERERGFNQAAELATLLSRRCGVPVAHALQRIRYTSTQTRLAREERMENLRGAFRVRDAVAVQGCPILLVDDVFTTGSTVDECARVLRLAGAASVRVATVARG